MKPLLFCAAAAGTLVALAGSARADIRLPRILSEGMVLQRDAPIRLWGWAADGETVQASFLGTRVSTTAEGGRWELVLPAPRRAGGPFPLEISGRNRIAFRDIRVGEVWICSGQSNMEWNMAWDVVGAAAEFAAPPDPDLRMFTVPHNIQSRVVDDLPAGSWEGATAQTRPHFSAVGYHFAKALRKALGVPVGMVFTAWGGTRVEAWTRREINVKNGEGALVASPADPRNPNAGSALYNGMIHPIRRFAVKGALWYQGESNAGSKESALAYRVRFPAMITNWREDFENPEMPFLLVQLAPFLKINPEPEDTAWAVLREAQWLTTRRLKNIGMAVIVDIGHETDIHPRQKQPVGERLALQARRIAYGHRVDPDGPLLQKMTIDGNRVILTFDHVGEGLVGSAVDSSGKSTEGKLVGFAVAGADGKFVWAEARIVGRNVVEVTAPQVTAPRAVRYGWANFPVVNLWNHAALPATPFRTDVPAAP